MTLSLPPHTTQGAQASLPESSRRIVIVGANGSGKSRFTQRLIADSAAAGDAVFCISALGALYPREEADRLDGSIDRLYMAATERSPFMRADHDTQFERVMALMLVDEVLHLLDRKLAGAAADSEPTRLDRVVGAWQEVFPDNKILRESGRLIFTRSGDTDGAYSQVRLSHGEKAVLYAFGATMFAPQGATIFVDSPEMFLHPSVMGAIWDKAEALRPDCRWVYTTHDLEFAGSRCRPAVVWVRSYDAAAQTWDYILLPEGAPIDDRIYTTVVGARKPVLFIEGDATHSIDARLYPLIFANYSVRSLGSCNKVIEATRTFNDLNAFHHLDSRGIVDRDRRDAHEVEYLRKKRIFVPNVAEIENILMLPGVVRAVARHHGRNDRQVLARVRSAVIAMFRSELKAQALMHTRHRVKRLVEYRIDARFPDIDALEAHMRDLVRTLRPRDIYTKLVSEFRGYVETEDYDSVLRVFNQKTMVSRSDVAGMCGLPNRDAYVNSILDILRQGGREAEAIRRSVAACFGLTADEAPAHPDPSAIAAEE